MELSVSKLLKVIKLSAQMLLENGGEIYRVEETIKYICKSFDVKEIDPIATPTGIYITISVDGIEHDTIVKRIKKISINLDKLHRVNDISRQLTAHNISLDEAITQLEIIRSESQNQSSFSMFYEGISAGFFSMLFGGGIIEFFIALISGTAVTLITKKFENLDSYKFFSSITAGFIISVIAITVTHLIGMGNYNYAIIGGIMPQLPGLAMTNAIRDTIRGDLISGMARATEALLVAASLATGAGAVMSIFYALGWL